MNNKEAQIGNDRKNLFLDSLTELTKVEFNNLCEKSSKSHRKLLYKAYKRTNSLKNLRDLSKKYELFLPHEEHMPTIIPFLLKKVFTNPSIVSNKQAEKYLESYSMVIDIAENQLSQVEVKECFDTYTFDFLKENLKLLRNHQYQ